MISLALSTLSPLTKHSSLSIRPSFFNHSTLKLFNRHNPKLYHQTLIQRKIGACTVCRAELSADAPFAAAIGACLLSSLLFPPPGDEDDDGGRGDSVLDSDDSRLIVMSIISFIPYFNWLSWVFAWLDTGKRRYGVYSLVYLIPYIRSNLSLSTDESWLPVASIILCVLHVQLEMSIKNGDIQGFQLFSKASKRVASTTKISVRSSEEVTKNVKRNLPSVDEKSSRKEIRDQGFPKNSWDVERLDKDWDENEKKKH